MDMNRWKKSLLRKLECQLKEGGCSRSKCVVGTKEVNVGQRYICNGADVRCGVDIKVFNKDNKVNNILY